MSPHQAVAVAVRLFAAWLGIYVLRTLPSYYFASHRETGGLAFALFLLAVTVVLVFVLWVFPQTIARRLLASQAEPPAAPASPDLWLATGCALIGLWVLTSSLPSAVRETFIISSLSETEGDTTEVKQYLVYHVVEVAIALWLIFGARGFRKIFWWARTAGYG